MKSIRPLRTIPKYGMGKHFNPFGPQMDATMEKLTDINNVKV